MNIQQIDEAAEVTKVARYFFELGYLACVADKLVGKKTTDDAIERAWHIAPACCADPDEFAANLALARAGQ